MRVLREAARDGAGNGKTGLVYAADADRAGEGKLGDALRIRCHRHESLESLAFGGIMSRPDYTSLQDELFDAKSYADTWGLPCEMHIQKRDIEDMCSTPGAVTNNWEAFQDKIQFWSNVGETLAQPWDPCNPKVRHISVTPEGKAALFMELLPEYAITP